MNNVAPHYFSVVDKNEEHGMNACVVLVDVSFWEKNHSLDVSGLDPDSDISILLEQNEFYELEESVYESGDEFDSYSTVRSKMLTLGFKENADFTKYVSQPS